MHGEHSKAAEGNKYWRVQGVCSENLSRLRTVLEGQQEGPGNSIPAAANLLVRI